MTSSRKRRRVHPLVAASESAQHAAFAATVGPPLAAALSAHGGNRAAVAVALGLSRTTVQEWLARLPEIAREYPPAKAGRKQRAGT